MLSDEYIIEYEPGVYISQAEANVLVTKHWIPGVWYHPITDIYGRWYISAVEAKQSTNTHPICRQIKNYYPVVHNVPYYVWIFPDNPEPEV